MEIAQNKLGLVLIALTVVVAGCSDTSGEDVEISQTSGVEVTSFSADPSTLSGGQDATLQLNIENRGGSEAENVQARLTDPEFDSSDSNLWSVSDNTAWRELGDLAPANPDAGQDALTRTLRWRVTAPDRDNRIPTPYEFDASLYYKYNTEAATSIEVVNVDALEENPTQSSPTVENTGAPIQLDVNAITPIRFAEGDESQQTKSMCVRIDNAGSGTPFVYEKAMMNGQPYRAVNSDIMGELNITVSTSSSVIEMVDQTKTVELIGETPSACFDMNVDYVSTSEVSNTAQFTIDADYGYRVKPQSANIEVKTGP